MPRRRSAGEEPRGSRAGAPPGPRARHLTREHVPLADVLAGYPTISRVKPGRAEMRMWRGPGRGGPGSALADSVLARTGTGAARDRGQGFRDQLARAGTGVARARLAQCEPGATRSIPPRAVRARRDEIHPSSIPASPPRTMRPEATSPKRLPPGRGPDGGTGSGIGTGPRWRAGFKRWGGPRRTGSRRGISSRRGRRRDRRGQRGSDGASQRGGERSRVWVAGRAHRRLRAGARLSGAGSGRPA